MPDTAWFFKPCYADGMKTRQDHSYGVLVFAPDGAVLMVEQNGSRGDVFWTFPKGHPEAGETPEETALREVEEETGITEIALHELPPVETSYTFTWQDECIEKTVTFFIGECAAPTAPRTDGKEIRTVRFVPESEVEALLTHENMRVVWRMAWAAKNVR